MTVCAQWLAHSTHVCSICSDRLPSFCGCKVSLRLLVSTQLSPRWTVHRALCVSPGAVALAAFFPGSAPGLLSQLFHRCQRAVQALPSRARRTCSTQEERLLGNVVASLAQSLQELSTGFRHAQSGYLKRECCQRFKEFGVRLTVPGAQTTSCFHPPFLLLAFHFVLFLSLLAFEHIHAFPVQQKEGSPLGKVPQLRLKVGYQNGLHLRKQNLTARLAEGT